MLFTAPYSHSRPPSSLCLLSLPHHPVKHLSYQSCSLPPVHSLLQALWVLARAPCCRAWIATTSHCLTQNQVTTHEQLCSCSASVEFSPCGTCRGIRSHQPHTQKQKPHTCCKIRPCTEQFLQSSNNLMRRQIVWERQKWRPSVTQWLLGAVAGDVHRSTSTASSCPLGISSLLPGTENNREPLRERGSKCPWTNTTKSQPRKAEEG